MGHYAENDNVNMVIYSEEEYKHFPVEQIFPLKPCKFMKLTVLCPRQSKEYLKRLYPDKNILIPNKACKNGSWEPI